MYKKQSGCLPFITFCIGIILVLYLSAVSIYGILYLKSSQLFTELQSNPLGIVYFIFLIGCFLFFPCWGIMIMDTFPAIKADDTGISVKNLFSTRHFDWGEINEIKNGCSPFKGTKVLTLSPRGNLLKNFLKYYPNYIHGMMAGVLLEPAILLSNGLPNREEILKEIGKHVLADMLSRPKLME